MEGTTRRAPAGAGFAEHAAPRVIARAGMWAALVVGTAALLATARLAAAQPPVTITVKPGAGIASPVAAVNPSSHRLYWADQNSTAGNVYVVNGTTNAVEKIITVNLAYPARVWVNPKTNKVKR